MRKNRLIALIGTLTMAAAGLAAVSAGVSKPNQALETNAVAQTNSSIRICSIDQRGWAVNKITIWDSSTFESGYTLAMLGEDLVKLGYSVYSGTAGTNGCIYNLKSTSQVWDSTTYDMIVPWYCTKLSYTLRNDTESASKWFESSRGVEKYAQYKSDGSWYDTNNKTNYTYAWSQASVTMTYNAGGSATFTPYNSSAQTSMTLYRFTRCTLAYSVDDGYKFVNWSLDGTPFGTSTQEQQWTVGSSNTYALSATFAPIVPDGTYLGGEAWGWSYPDIKTMHTNPSESAEQMISGLALEANSGVKVVCFTNDQEAWHGANSVSVDTEASSAGYSASGTGSSNTSMNKGGIYNIYVNTTSWNYHFMPLRINYNANGGSNTMSPTFASSSGSATVSSNAFSYPKHNFIGWNTQANGQGDNYAVGYTFTDFASRSENVTLYAQWEEVAQTYSVSYLKNTDDEVTNMPATETGVPAGTHNLSSTVPVRKNYHFVGWNTNPAATTGISSVTITDSNVNVYAIWSPYTHNDGYYVKVNDNALHEMHHNGGTTEETSAWTVDNLNLSANDELHVLRYEGDSPSGQTWGSLDLQNIEGTAKYANQVETGSNDNIKIKYDGTYSVTFNDLYGSFRIYIPSIRYNISYNENGGTKSGDTYVIHPEVGHKFQTPEIGTTGYVAPTGKTFLEWNTKADGTGNGYGVNTLVEGSDAYGCNSDHTFYAIWGDSAVSDGTYLRGSWGWNAGTQKTMNPNPDNQQEQMIKGVALNADDLVKVITYSSGAGTYHSASETSIDSSVYTKPDIDDNGNAKVKERGVFNIYVNTTTWNYHFYPLRVNYDGNGADGGTAVSSTYPSESGFKAIAANNSFEYENHTFIGWNTASDGTGDPYNEGALVPFSGATDNITLYAQWELDAQPVTVTYYDGATVVDELSDYPGETLVAPAVPDHPGYTGSWDKDLTEFPDEDTDVYAEYEANTYEINFNSQGGSAVDPISATFGQAMPNLLHKINKTGYDFLGFFDQASGGTKYYNADWVDETHEYYSSAHVLDIVGDDKDTVTLYAQWQAHDYTVHFNLGGAPGTVPSDMTLTYGKSMEDMGKTLPDVSNYYPGHTFAGWYLEKYDMQITDEDKLIVAEDITLTAHWTTNKYTITFKNEDGTELQSSQVEYGTMPTYSGATPTKAGDAHYSYTFKGWSPEVVAVTGEATYTATYTQSTNSYSVHFEVADGQTGWGTVPADVTRLYGTSISIENGKLYIGGAEFSATPSDPTAQYTFGFDEWAISGSVENGLIVGDVIVTASFTRTTNNYDVTLASSNSEYGTISNYSGAINVPYGTVITLDTTNVENDTLVINDNRYVATPATGDAQYSYSFTGWTGIPSDGVVVGTTPITAGFVQTVNKYTITFLKDDGETVVSTQSVDYDTMPEVPEGPAKPSDSTYSYRFVGWKDENGNAPVKVTGNATYTATYEATLLPTVEANRFITWFNEKMAVCNKDGHTDESALSTAWNSLWDKSGDVYTISYEYNGETYTLSNDAKLILSGAKGNPEGSNVEKFAFAYDYICGKYNLENFLGRNIKLIGSTRKLNSLSDVSTSTWIIAAVAITGIAAVGVFFIYRKRKEN